MNTDQRESFGPWLIRGGFTEDAEAIASVFTRSRRMIDFLPVLHAPEEDLAFITETVLREQVVTIAGRGRQVLAFLARRETMIHHLYVDPDFLDLGLGRALLQAAQKAEPKLELWCFQANLRARGFYENHGFRAVRFTDGRSTEEREPDVLYRWQRA